jgi:predicted transcriptional regulator
MAEGKVNVCYCVDESLRDDMQALSFMLRKSQSDIVSEALRTYIKRQGVQLPKRAA